MKDNMKKLFHVVIGLFVAIVITGIAGCGQIICETPTFSPVPGTFSSDQLVSISTTTEGATIYFTTDSSPPTTGSSIYSSSIPVTGNGTVTTIQAIAVKSGMENSDIASGTFTINSNTGILQWVWVAGNNTNNQSGIYGTQGTSNTSNKPGARDGGMSWIDTSGSLWVFGGYGFDANANNGLLNDLWKYEQSTGEWTWISGTSSFNQLGVYGTQGTGNTSDMPGAREKGLSWIDSSGDLWLFGGNGFSFANNGELNDLWKFDPSTEIWTWISGDKAVNQTGIYGTKGTGSISNKPGSRDSSVSWIDSSGDLWLFGGAGHSLTFNGELNDLWKFDPSTKKWTWVSGDTNINLPGVYGTKGTADSSNKPGSRDSSVSWIDSSGKLWLFGGNGFDANGNGGFLNDLWKFDPSTGKWTWISGSNTVNHAAVYGIKGTPGASNAPGARDSSVSWIDGSGRLWLFGGNGLDANADNGLLNDLWKFDPSTGEWTWISGSNTVDKSAVYGTKGTASASNVPGARDSSASWIDSSSNLWLFGGGGFDTSGNSVLLNDLWKFEQ